jgi:hypothetical protein
MSKWYDVDCISHTSDMCKFSPAPFHSFLTVVLFQLSSNVLPPIRGSVKEGTYKGFAKLKVNTCTSAHTHTHTHTVIVCHRQNDKIFKKVSSIARAICKREELRYIYRLFKRVLHMLLRISWTHFRKEELPYWVYSLQQPEKFV